MADGSSTLPSIAGEQQHRQNPEAVSSSPLQRSSVVQPHRSAWSALLWGLTVATTTLLLVSVVVTAFVTTTLLLPRIDVRSTFGQTPAPLAPPVAHSGSDALPFSEEASSAAASLHNKRLLNARSHETKPCDSTACVEQARMLLHQIDSSRDPCDDFYAYVCDKWAQSRPLTPGAERVSVDTAMVEDYAELLASALHDNVSHNFPQLRFLLGHCMDPEPVLFDNLIAMFMDTTHLRQWMVRASSSSRRQPSAAEVSRKFGLAFRQLGVDALFRPFVVKDLSHENKRFVGLEEPSTVLLRAPLEKEEYEVVRAGFAPLLAFFQNHTDADLLRFEKRLFGLLEQPQLDVAVLANGSMVKVRDLPALRNFEWTSFLQSVFGKGLRPITARTYVKLASPEYVLNLTRDGEIMRSSRELLGYLLFRISMALSPLLGGTKYRDQVAAVSCARHPQFAHALTPAHYCLCLLNRFEPNLPLHAARNLSRAQLSRSGGDGEDVLDDLVSTLRLVVIEHVLVRLARFGSGLKANLLELLNAVSWEPLAPRGLQENASTLAAYLDGIYKNNARTSTAQFFYTWIRKSLEKRLMAHMSSRASFQGWTGGFLSAEAHMGPPYNRLEIPLPVFDLSLKDDAALRPLQVARAAPRVYRPVFRAIYHWVFNLEFSGMRGGVHSLVQGFSDLRLCLERQYGSLSWAEKSAQLHASRTSWSDLWDLLSVRPALDAFLLYTGRVSPDYRLKLLERWNASQLFFLYYAANFCDNSNWRYLRENAARGPLSPAWYRVNGPLRNTPEFAMAFGCKPDSFMNPTQKCVLSI
ncbi:membrane metallo-endopeptidase-like 1 [Dermacentor variabilis]|uniref:membrane metallo-endopeptidase-like 1 n=1 Tax=Dermacentor variabilis TaxID=34621 RepID=UPI003F5C09AF